MPGDFHSLMPVPRKEHFVEPYAEPTYIDRKPRGYQRVEIDYRATQFERPPNRYTIDAFRLFYESRTGTKIGEATEEVQPLDFQLRFPREGKSLRFGVDVNKHYLYFRYGEEDEEAREIVNEFIRELVSGQA